MDSLSEARESRKDRRKDGRRTWKESEMIAARRPFSQRRRLEPAFMKGRTVRREVAHPMWTLLSKDHPHGL